MGPLKEKSPRAFRIVVSEAEQRADLLEQPPYGAVRVIEKPDAISPCEQPVLHKHGDIHLEAYRCTSNNGTHIVKVGGVETAMCENCARDRARSIARRIRSAEAFAFSDPKEERNLESSPLHLPIQRDR